MTAYAEMSRNVTGAILKNQRKYSIIYIETEGRRNETST
nr:MAG TPA: hypothetical protein [Caudoviricetes sp.]